MIVVEDRGTNEVIRFLVMDAFTKLGVVQFGTDIQTFDSQRMLRYYALVENQLFDFASRYPDSFRYLPRRAYAYLSKPPLLGDITDSLVATGETNWFSDQFMVHPLTEISAKPLPSYQQKANIESCFRWTTNSEDASRMYSVLDLEVQSTERMKWAVSIDAGNLSKNLQGTLKGKLIESVSSRIPLFIRLENMDEISSLLEWLVILKEAGISNPSIFLSVKAHKGWEKDLIKLLQMPGMRLLTSGATITSLSTIISNLRDQEGDNWSKKLVFASSYPETQMGDSITEILSYLFSKNLGASREEIQDVLAGNMIEALPSITNDLSIEYNNTSLFAESNFGKVAFRELLRLIRLLNIQKEIQIISVDIVPEATDGQYNLDSIIMTTRDMRSKKNRRFILERERNESLRLVGWRKSFDQLYTSKSWIPLKTHARASDKGPSLDSPSHVTVFNKGVLDILGIRDATSVLSSLHYQIKELDIDSGQIALCKDDIRAIGVRERDTVTVLDAESDHYWGAIVNQNSECQTRTVGLPKGELRAYGLSGESQVDLVKYNEEVADCQGILLTYRNTPGFTDSELSAYLHMAREEIESQVRNKIIGIGTRFVISRGLELVVGKTFPSVEKGHLVNAGTSPIQIQPIEYQNELNVIIIADNGNQMMMRDANLSTPRAIQSSLSPLAIDIPELQMFIEKISRNQSRWTVAATLILEVINSFRYNTSEGRLGLAFVDKLPHRFTIQKNIETQEFIKFDTDMRNEEILKSLIYSVIDAGEVSEIPTDSSAMFRAAAEMLEDIGTERPTLMILLLSQVGDFDEISPYLQIIESSRNIKVVVLGIGNQLEEKDMQYLNDANNVEFKHLSNYSIFDIRGLLVSKIREICHT